MAALLPQEGAFLWAVVNGSKLLLSTMQPIRLTTKTRVDHFYSLLFIELITAPSSAHGRHCPNPSLLMQPEASRNGLSSEIPGPEACARWRARVSMEHSFHQ